jgi:hypothetical protein
MKRPYCCDESRDLYERYYDCQKRAKVTFPFTWAGISSEDTESVTY